MNVQRSIYCGDLHRVCDGVPIDHACRILDPEYLEAERREEYGRAVAVLERMPLILHHGVRVPGVRAMQTPTACEPAE